MTALLAILLAQSPGSPSSMNLNEQAIIVLDEGVRVPGPRASRVNCSGAGVTCTQSGATLTLTIPGGGGGGGSANVVEVSVAITATGYFSATITGQTWVAAGSKILCEPFATTADGLTPEVIAISGIRATAANRVAATGFDVLVFNPHGLTGTVRFHCTGS